MTYPKLPGLTWDGTIYENDEMGTLEALLPTGGYPTAHAPAMAELPDGSLLCCWFAGTYEGSADIHIVCSILPKDKTAWTEPVNISGDPQRSEQNPSLFYGPDHAVWAMYTAQLDGQGQYAVYSGGTLPEEHRRRPYLGALRDCISRGRHILPPAHSGTFKWPLDLLKLALHRFRGRAFRRSNRFSDLR